jgi:hypothetical protein
MDGSPTIPDAKPFLQLQEEMELIAPDQALQEARSLKDAVMDLWSEAAQGKTSEPERFATYLASIDKFTQAARVSLGRAESKQDKGQ